MLLLSCRYLCCVVQGKTYWAVKDKGAWLRTGKNQVALHAAEFRWGPGVGQRAGPWASQHVPADPAGAASCSPALVVGHCSFEQPGLRLVGSSSHMSKETEEFIQLFTSPQFLQVKQLFAIIYAILVKGSTMATMQAHCFVHNMEIIAVRVSLGWVIAEATHGGRRHRTHIPTVGVRSDNHQLTLVTVV
jgi:hypothetical protein